MSEYERQYEDGSAPQVLDVIDVPVLESRPKDYQTENSLLDPKCCWEKAGRLSWFDLPALADPIAPLWIDGHKVGFGMVTASTGCGSQTLAGSGPISRN